jgi:hypothetical protein
MNIKSDRSRVRRRMMKKKRRDGDAFGVKYSYPTLNDSIERREWLIQLKSTFLP